MSQAVLRGLVRLVQQQQVWGMEICHGGLPRGDIAKDLPGTGQTSARKGFCHDEAQGLGAAGWWDGQVARMEGSTHERWGVSVWGRIRTRQHVRTVWGAAHRWGMGATAAASTRVRGGRGGGAAWTAVVVAEGLEGGTWGGRHRGTYSRGNGTTRRGSDVSHGPS